MFPSFKRSKTDSTNINKTSEVESSLVITDKVKFEASTSKSAPEASGLCDEKLDTDSKYELPPNLSTRVNTSWNFGDVDDILALDCDPKDGNSSEDVDPLSPKTQRDMKRDIEELCFTESTECDQEKPAKCVNENKLNRGKSANSAKENRLNREKSAKSDNENMLNQEKSAQFDNNNRLNQEKSAKFQNDNIVHEENPAKFDNGNMVGQGKSAKSDIDNNRLKRHPVIGFEQHLKLPYKKPLRKEVLKKGRNKNLQNSKYPIPPATLVNSLSLIRVR